MREGDIIEVTIHREKTAKKWIRESVKYRVLKIYPHFVLCQHYQAGYRECFQRRAAG